MFATLFLVCSLSEGKCISMTPPDTFKTEKTCNLFSEASRLKAKENSPPDMIVMYKCVEFPNPV